MLSLFRSKFAKIATLIALVIVLGAIVAASLNSLTTYPNLSKDQIDSLVQNGHTMSEVEAALGQPDSKEERLWYYSNARDSYRTESSIVPASISIGFDESGLVQMVLKGPVP